MRFFLVGLLGLQACFASVTRGKKDPCGPRTLNQNPLVTTLDPAEMDTLRSETPAAFPKGFLFGSATAAYQIESGNTATDWNVWEKLGKIQRGDRADDGPQHERHVAEDLALIKGAGHNTYRLSIEWGRLFPTRAQFDALEPDPIAFAHYRSLLEQLHENRITPMVTLLHFVLPIWIHDPSQAGSLGALDPELPALLARYAAWAAESYGDLVDLWLTVNEPSAVGLGGYIGAVFPPGKLLAFDDYLVLQERYIDAHARAYDELRGHDRTDADGDGVSALISFATHNRVWLPVDPNSERDVRGAKRLRWLANLTLIEAAVCGDLDRDLDEKLDAKNDRIADPTLRDRLDFIALNYYGTGWVQGVDLEPFRGLPSLSNDNSGRVQNDFGWDLAPEGLLPVLDELKQYELPIYITENGLADAADTRRPRFVVDTLIATAQAIAKGHDVRGYYHWSLLDNFEWASGFCPRFGLYGVDFADPTRPRIEREGGRVYSEIIANGRVPDELYDRYVYGAEGPRCP